MSRFPEKILYVEDTLSYHEIVMAIFESIDESINVECSPTVDDAITKIDSFDPSLILLDLKMPEKSGVDLLQAVQKDDISENLPVILVTGVEGVEMIDEYQRLGVLGVITKPFEKEAFVNTIIHIWATFTAGKTEEAPSEAGVEESQEG